MFYVALVLLVVLVALYSVGRGWVIFQKRKLKKEQRENE